MKEKMSSEMKKKENVVAGRGAKRGNVKRSMMVIVAVIGVALLAWLGFVLFGNNYKSNAMQMKVNTVVATRLANAILNDYQDNWVRVETDQLGKNAEGVTVSTDDAAQVLNWRKEYFEKTGAMAVLTQLLGDADECLSNMRLTPARYRDTKDNFKAAFTSLEQLVGLTSQPGNSLIALATKLGELNSNIEKSLEPTDFNFWVSFDEIKKLTDKIVPQLKDAALVDAVTHEMSKAQNNAVNRLKYKKLGFKELPKGKGVLYHVVEAGKGPKPKDDTKVKLNYEGKLMDGTIFDSSYQRGQPVTMRPSQTVPGFWHSLTNMPVGSKWEIYIPYSEAYGNREAGAVKPYSDLFFTIEVLGFEE